MRKGFLSYSTAGTAASYRIKDFLCMLKNCVINSVLAKLANTICVVRFLLADIKIIISILFSTGRTALALSQMILFGHVSAFLFALSLIPLVPACASKHC